MYCDRSAYYQKAIKATARRLRINTFLLWLFLLFGRLDYYNKLNLAIVILCFFKQRTSKRAPTWIVNCRFFKNESQILRIQEGGIVNKFHQPNHQLCSFNDYCISLMTGPSGLIYIIVFNSDSLFFFLYCLTTLSFLYSVKLMVSLPI